nr:serine/threonine-protein kinase [Streptomyces sp. S1D4-11]QIY93855.1 protein kinase [Streptomyces sp. S1D4-11]
MTEGQQGAERLIAGRYRLLRRLGAGGMGRVWLAYDQELECEVALKELTLPEGIPEQELSARVARARAEARHAARLRNHPHVATVHDVVEEHGLPWIVMGFLPGATDLKEVVREHGPLPPAETARIGLAVLDALMAGHRIGILHRDVKPANILLTRGNQQDPSCEEGARVLLADYGISLQPDSGEPRLTGTSGIVGTPGYLAPERARGAPPSPASDLFSLGATLYYAVEGNGPFDRPSDVSTLTALLFEEPTPPTQAGDLGPVLADLMVKDPAERMGADEAMHRLAGLTAAPQPASRTPEPAPRTADTTPLPEQPPASQSSPGTPSDGESSPAAAVPRRPRHPKRPKADSGRTLGFIAAVLLLIGGGIWAGVALLNGPGTQTPQTGPVLPYGNEVGLTRELRPGDCVSAAWSTERFQSLPKLKIVDCKNYPDAQVLDVNATTSLADARTNGPGVCIGLLRDQVRKMTDVQSFALAPSGPGWDNGARNTPCLLFGKTVSLYGPVAGYRKHGDQIFVENSSIGDCFNTRKLGENNYARLLVDCNQPHEEQVLGYVKAPQSMKFGSWDAMHDLCVKQYGSYKDPTRDLSGWVHEEETWNDGFRFVACMVTASKGGQKLPPGSALAAVE